MGDDGASSLASCIRQCTRLEKLSIRSNCIGNTGAKELAESLGNSCTDLIEFDIRFNTINDDGALITAQAMTKLQKVTILLWNP